ncbi:MAG TPA: LexA family transcriptional regulator [Pseudolabrys sp.]|nr:LexA family transcriptional regulator [Pseudolabrys sp.]
MAAKDVGERIRAEREARGWTQTQLGDHIGISQVAIAKIEMGETKMSKYLAQIARAFDLPITDFVDLPEPMAYPGQPKRREGDFPVYAAAEGGPGEIVRSTEAVDWQPRPKPVLHVREAYGVIVTGESMVPEYRPGDTALVNPKLPVIPDEVYIFYAEEYGEARATIKHLRRATADKWLVTQHNPRSGKPKDFTLSRKEWRLAHRVVGKYSRRS